MKSPGLQHLRPFLVHEWRALAGAGLMSILLTVAELARPWPLKFVIDHLIGGHTAGFALSGSDFVLLAIVAVVTIAVAMLDGSAQYCSDLWLQRAGERIAHRLRIRVYDHLQALSLRFHLRREKGDLVTRVTADVNSIGDLFAQSMGQIFQGLLLLAGMLVIATVLDPVLALTMCVSLPLLTFVSFSYRQRVRATSRRQRAQEGEIASRATEALSAMPVIKAFGSERIERERVTGPSELRMALGVEVARLQAAFNGLVTVLVAVGTAAIVVVGVWRISTGNLTVGDLVVFATYAQRVNRPLRDIAREWTKVAKTLARADQIAELLALDDVLAEVPGAYDGPRAAGAIDLDGVSFHYEDGRQALRDVSLSIRPGEHIAIIGPSGAGKSTLTSLVARFHDPTSGSILLDGRDARDCSLDWLRRQVGVLLQDTVLFTGTVAANIAYASDAEFPAIAEAARLAAADDFIETLPEGYDTELGPQGMGLSGGQRQRVGIARTILRDPAILILDEPTTGLDVESEAQVLDGLDGLMQGRTTLMVTHSLALAHRADRVIVVDDGRIAADGPPDEVLAEHGPWRRHAETRPLRTAPRPDVPVDRELPQLRRLLDPDETRRRAIMRLNGHELHAYAQTHDFEAAVTGAERAREAIATPGLELALNDLRLTVVRAVDGNVAPHNAMVSARAGQVLRRLHASDATGLQRFSPERELASARAIADLTATVVPGLAPRLEALMDQLADTLPCPDDYVASHGDFHADQLLVVDDELLLKDFDDMCLAPAALDVATWGADVVRGRGNELEALHAAVEPLLEGYGKRPDALEWYIATGILKRAADPFRKQVPGWALRVVGTVRAAEEAMDA